MELNKRGLLIGFTKWQVNTAYKIFANNFDLFGVKLDLVKSDEYVLGVENGQPNLNVKNYDFLIQLVKDQYISTLFEKEKKPCFNKYLSMCYSDDKFLTYVKLAENEIMLPKTLSGNTDFDGITLPDFKRSKEFRHKVEKSLGYPFVAKPTFGYGGRGICIIKNRKEFDEHFDNVGQTSYMYQEYIPDNSGSDIRCIVVGKKFAFAIKRENPNDFKSNISTGGFMTKWQATKEQKKVAEKVAKILDLDYCSVDFFNTIDNRPLVCEVNANPGGIDKNFEMTGVNQAEELVKIIVHKIYKE